MKEDIAKTLSIMADKWPSAIVSRSSIDDFTGGLIKPSTMANVDSGLKRIKHKQKVFYLVHDVVEWLANDCSLLGSSGDKKDVQVGAPRKTAEEIISKRLEDEEERDK